ncbi:GntR family transcriptional regulator [Pseudomonas citronellolis]|uniref:GntR family transcriptional regulator n=1 Tax=Pseudomonas citronellolis TaxID=53408 RepID=UPI003204DD9D
MAENLQEQLYQNLRQALLSGRFQPGERLKIRDLADEWGTSPMPVRAALQRLVAEGALEGEPQRSLRVPLMTRERFLQILQVRQSLEGLAAEDAVPRLEAVDIRTLEVCTEAMEAAVQRRDVAAYLEHNSRFHLTLYRACGNPTLLRMIEALWLQVGPFFNRLFTEADLSLRLNDFHEHALEAVRRGDARGARAAIEQDLGYFGQFLLNLLSLESGSRRDAR